MATAKIAFVQCEEGDEGDVADALNRLVTTHDLNYVFLVSPKGSFHGMSKQELRLLLENLINHVLGDDDG